MARQKQESLSMQLELAWFMLGVSPYREKQEVQGIPALHTC